MKVYELMNLLSACPSGTEVLIDCENVSELSPIIVVREDVYGDVRLYDRDPDEDDD